MSLIPPSSPLHDPKREEIARDALAQRAYERAFERAAQDASDAPALRAEVAALQAEVRTAKSAFEAAAGRPISIKMPAEPKAAQHTPRPLEILAASVLGEARRRAHGIAVEKTLADLWPRDTHDLTRRWTLAAHKAASTPQDTATDAALVDTLLAGFWSDLRGRSALADLAALANTLSFAPGRGSIVIPHRDHGDDGTLAPAWIAEGDPIPVKRGTLASTTLQPFKLGVISVVSDELVQTARPDVLGLIEDMIADDLAAALDARAFSTSAAVADTAPAGLALGATTQASAGTSLAQVLSDLRWLRSGLRLARRPVIVMSSDLRDALEWLPGGNDAFPLQAAIRAGEILGLRLVASPLVAAATVWAFDAAGVYIGAGQPRVQVSAHATISMRDDPGQIGADMADAGVGGDVIGTFQTDGQALRLIAPTSWGVVSPASRYLTGVTWGA